MQSMDNTVRIFFAGDFCSKPSTSVIKVSDDLRGMIQSCDIKVVNFEVPLRPDGLSLPPQRQERFFQNDDVPDFLRDLGFNVFQLANNHLFDWGEEGYRKTIAALGDSTLGAGTYDDAYRVKVLEINGVKVGFLGLCFAAYTGVFDDVAKHEGLGCAYINDLRVNHLIVEAKKELDFLFVMPHDGIEYVDIPLPETIARYRDFIDYGADAVIGTHPHCPQGWETYKGKPIFYSLGNFLFNSKVGYDYRATNRNHWYEGLCVLMTINDGRMDWEIVNTRNVDNVGIIIDREECRNRMNAGLCNYLTDKNAYQKCLKHICDDLGEKELSIIEKASQSKNFITRLKLFLKPARRGKTRGQSNGYYSLMRLLRHDSRRHLLLWRLKELNGE